MICYQTAGISNIHIQFYFTSSNKNSQLLKNLNHENIEIKKLIIKFFYGTFITKIRDIIVFLAHTQLISF